MGFEFHGGDCPYSHGSSVSVWGLQVPERAYLDRRRVPSAHDTGDGFQRAGAALRPRRLLGTWYRSVDRQPSSYCGSYDREGDARWADYRGRDALAILCP